MLHIVLPLAIASPEAEQPRDHPVFGLSYGVGVSTFFGSLTDEQAALTHTWQLQAMFLEARRVSAYLSIDTQLLFTEHTGDTWPFPEDADLYVLSFQFLPMVCNSHQARVQVCGAIGEGTVNVNAEGHRRDYGTWNYMAETHLNLGDHWRISLLGKLVGRVEQEVDGQPSAFSYTTVGVNLGGRI